MTLAATHTTTDLTRFAFHRSNRKRNPQALARIRKSVRRIGLRTDLFPVVVMETDNGSLLVLDGQHRVIVAREMAADLGTVEVFYTIAEGLDVNDVAVVNAAQTTWGLDDYVRHHAEKGLGSYGLIIALMDEHAVSAYVAAVALGVSYGGPLKSGAVAVNEADYLRATTLLQRCADFSEEVDNHVHWHPFVKAVREVSGLPGYDHNRMMMRAERYGVKKQANAANYIPHLLSVYNTRTPGELRIAHPQYGDGS